MRHKYSSAGAGGEDGDDGLFNATGDFIGSKYFSNGSDSDTTSNVVNHRSLWLALTLFRVLEHEAWASHPRWRRAMQIIAVHSPNPLLAVHPLCVDFPPTTTAHLVYPRVVLMERQLALDPALQVTIPPSPTPTPLTPPLTSP